MRKVLSFVLVLALVLSSFSMAFADTTSTKATTLSDVKGNTNEDAIQVSYDLGIVTGNPDGTFQPAKAVTRAEFAAMITRALAIPDSALAGYATANFKDTNGYSWAVPYLAFCNSKGIMLGDGAGNAMPGKTITVNEAITMSLRAVGYTANSSELVGVWPSNYVTKGQEVGLYDDVNKDATGVDKANAAQIIYNTLTVQKVAVNSDGKTEYLFDNAAKTVDTTLLTAGLDCAASTDYEIVGDDFGYDDSLINITGILGSHGTSYTKKSGENKNKVVAFTKSDSEVLIGHMDGDKFKANDVKYSFASSVSDATTIAGITNGVEKTGAQTIADVRTTKTFEGASYSDDGDVIVNVELSGKTIKNVWSVVAWKATDGDKVVAADLNALKDNELLSGDFTEADDKTIDRASFELVGAANLEDIKADNIVYIYEEPANGDIRKVAVGTEKVTGTVDEIDGADITVNGKVYSFYDKTMNVSVAEVNDVDDTPDAGDAVTLTLDGNGYIYDCEATGSADTFAVVKSFDDQLGSTRAKLYTSADETKTYNFADEDDVTFEKTAAGATNAGIGMTYGGLANGALIGYGLDKNGDVDTLNLNTHMGTSAKLQTAKLVNVTVAGVMNTYPVDDAVKVFTNKAGSYDITDVKNVELGKELAVANKFYFIMNKDQDKIVAMIVDDAQATKGDDDLYSVVSTLTTKANADGDEVQRVVGFANGVALDKLTSDKGMVTISNSTIAAFTFKTNASGEISRVAGEASVVNGTLTTGALANDNNNIKIGTTWYSLAKDAVVYEATMKSGNTKVDYYEVSKASALREADNYMVYAYDMDNTSSDSEGIELVIFYKIDK